MADVNEMTDDEYKKYLSDVINKNFKESFKNDDKNSRIEHQDLSKTNEFLEEVNEFIKQIQEDTKKSVENNESLKDKIEEIGSNKLEAIKVNTENSLNSMDDMFNAVRAMGLLLGGVLNCNETMAQFCLRMGDELNKSKEGSNLSNVNAITGNNSEYVNEWLEYDDKSKIWVKHTLNEELPVVKKSDEDLFFGNSFDPYYSDNDKTKMLMAGLASGGAAKAKMSIADETLKREAEILGKSKFGKEIAHTLDPIGETSKNVKNILKTTKDIEKMHTNKTLILAGIGVTIFGIFGIFKKTMRSMGNVVDDFKNWWENKSFSNFIKIFTSDSFKRVLWGTGLTVLTVGGGLLATAVGLGILPLKSIAMAILGRLSTMRGVSNNVPIDGVPGGNSGKGVKGFFGKGGLGRRIGGGLVGIGAGLGTELLFSKIGELIGGEDGARVGGEMGVVGGIMTGEMAYQMVSNGIGPKAASKAMPKGAGILSAIFSGFEAISHLSDAATDEKYGRTENRNKSLLQAGVSVAGPVLGGILGSFIPVIGPAIGITIGSMLSAGVNALIENTKTTKENTEAEQDYSKSQEALLNRLQIQHEDTVQPIPTPQDSIENTNKIVENCIDKLTLTYEGQNKELINALAEKDVGLHAAKVDYLRGAEEPNEYTAKINSEFLKSFANMNSSLKNICDNTKIDVNFSFNNI